METYDVVIIGAGAAGLSAGIYTARSGLKTLIIEKKTVKTNRTEYETNAVIIATGAHYRQINVPGEKEFRGKGVSYCGVCDGPLFKSKRVLVIGGGNSAAITTLYLSGIAAAVTVVHRREAFRCDAARA